MDSIIKPVVQTPENHYLIGPNGLPYSDPTTYKVFLGLKKEATDIQRK